MSKIDLKKLQNLSVLEEEIRILESRRKSIKSDLETLTRETLKTEREAKQRIAIDKQEAEDKINIQQRAADRRDKELTKRENQIAVRESETDVIKDQQKKLTEKTAKIAAEMAVAEGAKVSYLEKERLADLRAKQLEAKINELGGKVKEVKAKPKEVVKPKKKKGKK